MRITAVIIVCLLLVSCKTTGYYVRLETDALEYNEVSAMEKMFEDQGYRILGREQIRGTGNPNDVTTFLKKELSDKKDWYIFIVMLYSKNASKFDNVVKNFRIDIYNVYAGLIIPEIKIEIDNAGNQIYEQLTSKVGKENVIIERKAWGPPVIY